MHYINVSHNNKIIIIIINVYQMCNFFACNDVFKSLALTYTQSLAFNSLCSSAGVEKNAFDRLPVSSLKYQSLRYLTQVTSLSLYVLLLFVHANCYHYFVHIVLLFSYFYFCFYSILSS